MISTGIVGVPHGGPPRLIGLPVSLAWALVFGALISPTDPVAVMSTLARRHSGGTRGRASGRVAVQRRIGIVLFTVLLRFATGAAPRKSAPAIAELLLVEAGGGILLGLVTGYVAYWGMRLIDDYPIEVLISLALVTGTYAVAQRLQSAVRCRWSRPAS